MWGTPAFGFPEKKVKQERTLKRSSVASCAKCLVHLPVEFNHDLPEM
jgi:hypothetical protein